MAVDDAVAGVMDHPNDIDLFVFDAVGGESYQIEVTLGTLGYSEVALYDAAQTLLGFSDDYSAWSAPRIYWTAQTSGRYYVEVTSLGAGPGSYWLTIAVSDIVDDHAYAISEATSVTVGDAIAGVVNYPGDIDLFAFNAEEGKLYQIDVTPGTLDDSEVALYDAGEQELAFNDDHRGSSASRVVWAAPDSGTYYVEVASFGDGTGSYWLTIVATDIIDDHADTSAQATPVTAGEAVPGVVNYPGDIDVFAFDAEEGNLYQINVTLGTLGYTVMALYDAHETPLASNRDPSGWSAPRVLWEAPRSGRYYVAVTSLPDDTGFYTLTITVR